METQEVFSSIEPQYSYYEGGSTFGKNLSGKILEKVNACVNLYLRPLELWMEHYADLFLVQPSLNMNDSIKIIALVASAILILPTAIIGCGVKSALASVKKDFVWIKPSENPILPTPSEITLATFNMALLPEFISKRNHLSPTAKRKEVMIPSIKLSFDQRGQRMPDIFWGQEVFDKTASDHLAKDLQGLGYSHIIKEIADRSQLVGSGLFLASRYPLQDVVFYPHPIKMGIEKHANKGLLIATALVGDKKIVLAGTHLNGGCDLGGFFPRSIQIQAIMHHIDEYIKEKKSKFDGVILSGDFNIAPVDFCDKHEEYYIEKESFWNELIYQNNIDETLLDQPISQEKRDKAKEALKKLKHAMPNKNIEDPASWKQYFNLLTQIQRGELFPEVDHINTYLERLFEKNLYSPLPREVYNANIYSLEEGLGGTALLLERPKEKGLYIKQPKRLDYHLVHTGAGHTTVKEPSHVKTTVIDIEGQPSDHCLVYSKFSLSS